MIVRRGGSRNLGYVRFGDEYVDVGSGGGDVSTVNTDGTVSTPSTGSPSTSTSSSTSNTTPPTDSSSIWSTLTNIFKTVSKVASPAPAPVVTASVIPSWVWIAVPAGLGALIFIAAATGGRRRDS